MLGVDLPDFSVKQGGRVGIDAQQVRRAPGSPFQDEILKQFPLDIFVQFTLCYLHISSISQLLI